MLIGRIEMRHGKLNLSSYKWKLLLLNEFAGRLSALHLENKKIFLIICL